MKFKEYLKGEKMKNYDDYKNIEDVKWTKYKIIVPTEEDRLEIMRAFKHIHDSNIDTEFVTVNQLCHEYSPLYYDKNKPKPENDPKNHNIIVDKKLYKDLSK